MDAPSFRIWPPVALGVPLAAGWGMSASVGDPLVIGHPGVRATGWFLVAVFGLWNGWALQSMARHRTALLPGGATTTVIQTGPYRFSRNPLYVGLIVLDIGLALLSGSLWALVLVPLGVIALVWGAILPEERYLSAKFGTEYAEYCRRVRRWL